MFYTNFHENFWRTNAKQTKITGKYFLAERKSGASDHQTKPRKKIGITRPRPDFEVTRKAPGHNPAVPLPSVLGM